MVHLWYMTPFLLATTVLADYDIDNSNTSVIYTFPPDGSGWNTYSVATVQLNTTVSNSTGNYTVILDASNCYDQNYAEGCCGTKDNCLVQIPFTGSGITMYIFNAGQEGVAANFSVDSGEAVSREIQAPPPPTYQVSNVSMYDIQGLTSGNHTMVVTLLDWAGSYSCLKFDYALVNETLVELSETTSAASSQTSSQTPTQTSTGNSLTKINVGGVIGGTLGGTALLASLLIGLFCLRKKHKTVILRPDLSPVSTFHVDPFTSQYQSSPTPPRMFVNHVAARHAQMKPSANISPFERSAILRDALAAGNRPSSEPIQGSSSQSIGSGMNSLTPPVLQPLHGGMISVGAEVNDPNLNVSRLPVADANSPFVDPAPARISLTTEQLHVIDQLHADNLPAETISHLTVDESAADRSVISTSVPPPSYQTRDR